MKRSPLHARHESLSARMLPFAGWEMPIQYEGIVAEHRAVRESVGVFDISHMGELVVSGQESEAALNRVLTNDLAVLAVGEGQYSLMLNEGGGVIDDLIVYRIAENRFFLVVNASKIQEDVEWLRKRLPAGVSVEDESATFGALAVQGPEAVSLWQKLEPSKPLPPRNGVFEYADRLILCRTGYTGEDGFELFSSTAAIGDWFDRFIAAGAKPCGLGARDTLRLEKGFPLNGADLDLDHTPLEAGLGFFVKLEKSPGFIGQESLLEQKSAGLSVRLAAIAMTGKAPPPRHGYEVRDEEGEELLGVLTSGSMSPELGLGIGMAYLPIEKAKTGTALSVMVRERPFSARVVKKPFV
ncbi:MAG: glycine cleavage system aminomethyltransferase GcvT [Verrucomicrobiales bacterium]|nr:glycine cleavage system aminomethyltransferase GcvT [Verrucomicrobiales bacterium]